MAERECQGMRSRRKWVGAVAGRPGGGSEAALAGNAKPLGQYVLPCPLKNADLCRVSRSAPLTTFVLFFYPGIFFLICTFLECKYWGHCHTDFTQIPTDLLGIGNLGVITINEAVKAV